MKKKSYGVLVFPDALQFCTCCCSLSKPEQIIWLRLRIRYNEPVIFELLLFHNLSEIHSGVKLRPILVIRYHFFLLGPNIHFLWFGSFIFYFISFFCRNDHQSLKLFLLPCNSRDVICPVNVRKYLPSSAEFSFVFYCSIRYYILKEDAEKKMSLPEGIHQSHFDFCPKPLFVSFMHYFQTLTVDEIAYFRRFAC